MRTSSPHPVAALDTETQVARRLRRGSGARRLLARRLTILR
jgi:hypothetical protein